ncbi:MULTISPECIES: hypothetical protein [Bacillus]|uniref:hypothetical protein n=1 Tax=Bacillus TaxID=1386 RepID=UPI000BB68556|nr:MULTISPECIES: hypothetical protein [Bacillus]
MIKKQQQINHAPLMYIVSQPIEVTSRKMQEEYRFKVKGKKKGEAGTSEESNMQNREAHIVKAEGDISIEETTYKPYRIYKKEMTSQEFYDYSIEERIEYLSSLPPYLKHIVLEFKINKRIVIGKIYTYQREEKTLMILNTNNLNLLPIKIEDIQYLKIISL